MDLIAGDAREIVLALSVDDWDGLRDRGRFVATLSLGAEMEPEWLDLFALAAREALSGPLPRPFADARSGLRSTRTALSDRTVERVDRDWIASVAALAPNCHDRIASRWLELLVADGWIADSGESAPLHEVVERLTSFCRAACEAEDVLLAWTI
jgi:hypothetical protein